MLGVTPDYYAHTNVLVNHLGIRDAKTLARKEAGLTATRSLELTLSPTLIPHSFDLAHLSAIHHHLFQDIYEWAGRIRDFDMRKGHSIFCPAAEIIPQAKILFEQIHIAGSMQSELDNKYQHLAKAYCQINKLHPFPEGNGRCQRLFISQLASIFGTRLHWQKVHQWEIVETAKRAHESNDYRPAQAMIERVASD